jgi:hypothetical protein
VADRINQSKDYFYRLVFKNIGIDKHDEALDNLENQVLVMRKYQDRFDKKNS